ncbi:endopeptidase La [[Mycoplasma] anseris]|uniref:Lon protease n=1 Tax=[Mycoplasma] anseris TaxID=92400 RepID=A0A2Z4NDE0_9BACT|nr:endopeptidase La [[Mycoplasma] anseris]AWX69603.1 endopeptidase La [[Mycoplasma] anseris]
MKKIPFLPIKNQIILPGMTDNIKIGKENSLKILDLAIKKYENNLILGVYKNNEINEEFERNTIFDFGFLTEIESISEQGIVKIVNVNTKHVVRLKQTDELDGLENASIDYEIIKEDQEENIETLKKIFSKIEDEAQKFNFETKKLPKEEKPKYFEGLVDLVNKIKEISYKEFSKFKQCEEATWNLLQTYKQHIDLIKEKELFLSGKLSTKLFYILNQFKLAINYIKLEDDINYSMRGELEEQQRDFMLREKMNQIKKLLNDEPNEANLEKITNDPNLKEQYPDYVLEAIKFEQSRIASMMPSSPEANITKTYLDLVWKLPWRKVSKEIIDINNVRKILDSHHYGLEKPKERILEFISVLTHTQNAKKVSKEVSNYVPIPGQKDLFIDKNLFINKGGVLNNESINNIPILTLIGPPGTGKTTLAKSIAEALGRKFVKISLGGVKDESEIRGHRRTYVGAMPGKIIDAIKKAGVSNPVILLDEIDKMSSDFRGDPTSAMLEVLDPEQNVNFQDHYLDLEYDLSKVLFIATANYYDSIPPALIDRVELLELSTYTTFEKIAIAKNYLLPKITKQNYLKPSQIQVNEKVLEFLIRYYTRESGVRELQRILDNIARKIVVRILDKEINEEFVVTEEIAKDFLGPLKFEDDENENKAQIGVVNGLAYTSFGGSTLAIEVTTFPGKEGLKLTGQLKDVMKESAQIALAYVRANAEKYGINFDFDNNSIHIHVPAGAIPKDGPSAGVTFTTSIISALSKKPVPANVGMTGEITLRGKVLPIGGLKEKSLAATQFGIRKIFIPYDNQKNLDDVPKEVKEVVKFIPVKYYDEIYNELFKEEK